MGRLFLLICVIILLCGCANGEVLQGEKKFVLGTYVSIKLLPVSGRVLKYDLKLLFAYVKKMEKVFSPYISTSLVSRLNRTGSFVFGNTDEHKQLLSLLRRSIQLSRQSSGAFDPVLHPLTSLWRFSAFTSRKRAPAKQHVKMMLRRSGIKQLKILSGNRVVLTTGSGIDLGAIAKGTVADGVVKLCKKMGYKKGIVDFGGDLYLMGNRVHDAQREEKGWIVAIKHPRQLSQYYCYLRVADQAVVTSGDYERFFFWRGKRYHHILDPQSGYPGRKCVSVTVVGPSVEKADGYATAIFVMGPKRGIDFINKVPGYGAMVLYKKNKKIVPLFSNSFQKRYQFSK